MSEGQQTVPPTPASPPSDNHPSALPVAPGAQQPAPPTPAAPAPSAPGAQQPIIPKPTPAAKATDTHPAAQPGGVISPLPADASPTAQDTHEQDPLGMGRTAGQRTAEVFAGLRAELMRSPETDALTRISGRITARMIKSVGSPKVLNFVPVRDGSFAGLIKKSLGSDLKGKVLVEVAAGFSARGLHLAQEMPDLQVIEVDLPDVVQEKQKRLERGRVAIPPNISWKSADLGVQPLGEVLEQQKVDVVAAEGLMPYFEFSDITRIAHLVLASLKPGGVFIADLGFTDTQGAKEASGLVQIFRRYTRSSPGAVNDEETAYRLFREAGYGLVELYRMPQTASMFKLPQPVSDVLFFMVAHNQ